MDAISQTTFSNAFFWWKCMNTIKISPKFVPKGQINNIPALVQIMAWRRPGDKPLSEPKMVSLPTHICVIRSQWVGRVRLIHGFGIKWKWPSTHMPLQLRNVATCGSHPHPLPPTPHPHPHPPPTLHPPPPTHTLSMIIEAEFKTADVFWVHYSDVIMGAMASQITRLTIVYSTVYLGANQMKHQSSTSLAFTGDLWIPCTNGQWRGKWWRHHALVHPWFKLKWFGKIWA